MVVVLPFVEFIHRLATFKVVATQDAGLLKLCEHAVNSGQSNVRVLQQQVAKHIFGGHVALRTALKNVQDFQPRQCGFETVVFQFVDLGHESVCRGLQNRCGQEAAATMT